MKTLQLGALLPLARGETIIQGGQMLLYLLMQTPAEREPLDLQRLPVGSRAVPARPLTTASERYLSGALRPVN